MTRVKCPSRVFFHLVAKGRAPSSFRAPLGGSVPRGAAGERRRLTDVPVVEMGINQPLEMRRNRSRRALGYSSTM